MAQVHLGINKANPKETVEWDSTSVINGHMIIVGGSGAGKTHQIRNISGQLSSQGLRNIIFDPHGDIETDPRFTSVVEFSEISPYGINPLIINPSPIYGGVRKRMNGFIKTINKYSESKLDERQEAALRYSLMELYALHGFDFTDHRTWGHDGKRIPTLDDLDLFLSRKLKGFFFGHMRNVSEMFDKLAEGLLDLRRLKSCEEMDDPAKERPECDTVKHLQQDLIRAFSECVGTIRGDEVDQYVRYGSMEVIKSLYDRVQNMKHFGVFKPVPPPFDDSKPIWRYDMRNLYVEEQGYLVELTLEQIFADAIQRGLKQNDVDTLIFIDEAQRFLSPEDQDHIVSVIFREIRKFGVGLALATQNCSAFPTDIIINSGTKMILGVDEAYQDLLAKTLGVERVRFIQPQKNALIQIKTKKTSVGSRFVDTLFRMPPAESLSQVSSTNTL